MVAVVIAAAMERSDRLLNAGPLAWSGLLSYSLYLWQQPLLVMGGPLDYVSVRLPILFAAAWISYRLVEQPALRLFATGSGKSLELSSVPGAVPET
jgi:peptidoglycan/LPS O-acetylase OafA/YrhL